MAEEKEEVKEMSLVLQGLFLSEVKTNKIHQYNGDGINVANVDFSNKQEYNKLLMQANYHVNQRLNVVQTIDYVPKVTYKTYYNSHFSW